MKKALLILVLILSGLTCLTAQNMPIEPEIRWEISEDRLIVIVQAPSKGRIFLALGAESDLRGSNILVVWVDDMMGIAMGEDHFGTDSGEHKNDMELGGSQNIQVLAGRQTDEMTEVTFAIPLMTDDEYDTPLEAGESYPIILGCTDSDQPDGKTVKEVRNILILN